MKTVSQQNSGTLNEWRKFLNTLSNTKSGEPLLKKAQFPERMLKHLEGKLASVTCDFI